MTSSRFWLTLLPLLLLGLARAAEEPALEISKDEQAVLDLTNEARAKEKLPALKPNAVLFKVARAHSANQAKQQKMAHELDGKSPADRVDAAGYDYKDVGENVGHIPPPLRIKELFDAWMKSPEHRKNILDKDFQEIGLGIVRQGNKGDFYFTQVFGTLQK
jgi:uncharacterized protein YkwD